MVGKIVCSRKISTQDQKHQIALAKGGAGSETICTGLVKVGAAKFTRTAEMDRYKDETSSSGEGWSGEVH